MQYCSDASEITVGQGRGIMSGRHSDVAISRSELRDFYLRQDKVTIKESLDTSHGLPRFNVVSQELEPLIVDSALLPRHTVDSMFSWMPFSVPGASKVP